jgi:hypothetical protein
MGRLFFYEETQFGIEKLLSGRVWTNTTMLIKLATKNANAMCYNDNFTDNSKISNEFSGLLHYATC